MEFLGGTMRKKNARSPSQKMTTALLLLLSSTLLGEEVCVPCCSRFGVKTDIEFLYWYAKEDHLPIATETVLSSQEIDAVPFFQNLPKKEEYMPSAWDPGFRVGLGMELCSCWDIDLFWTYMKNEKRKKLSTEPFQNLLGIPIENGARSFQSPWIFPAALAGVGGAGFHFSFPEITAQWKLHYNLLDWKFSRQWRITDCFFFRPYMGLRGAWTKIEYSLSQEGGVAVLEIPILSSYQTSFTNRFYGGGVSGGIESTWFVINCLGLYGQLEGALLWGKFKERKAEAANVTVEETPSSFSYKTKGDHHEMQGVIDLGIGLRYRVDFCCERFLLGVDLGWEHHLWLDHVHRFQIDSPYSPLLTENITTFFEKTDEIETDLVLGGLIVRVCFDF